MPIKLFGCWVYPVDISSAKPEPPPKAGLSPRVWAGKTGVLMSKISKLLVAASFASLLCAGGVLAQTSVPWTVEDSTIADIRANPAALAIFQKHFPDVAADARLGSV